MGFGDGEFAIVPQRLAVRDDIVPDETGGGIRQRVHAAVGHAMHVAAGKTGERSLQVIAGHGAVGPLVAVGAEDAGAVSVVEQDELTRYLVMVGGDVLIEDADRKS